MSCWESRGPEVRSASVGKLLGVQGSGSYWKCKGVKLLGVQGLVALGVWGLGDPESVGAGSSGGR